MWEGFYRQVETRETFWHLPTCRQFGGRGEGGGRGCGGGGGGGGGVFIGNSSAFQQQYTQLKGCCIGAKGTHVMTLVMVMMMMMMRTLELTNENYFEERACLFGVKGTHRSIKHIREQWKEEAVLGICGVVWVGALRLPQY